MMHVDLQYWGGGGGGGGAELVTDKWPTHTESQMNRGG